MGDAGFDGCSDEYHAVMLEKRYSVTSCRHSSLSAWVEWRICVRGIGCLRAVPAGIHFWVSV